MDDLVNFLPARISGLILILAALIMKLDYRNAARIYFRDRLCHSSPNAGHTEAAVAGALGVSLGGPSVYFGEVVNKPFMGDNNRHITAQDIKTSNYLVMVGAALFIVLLLSFKVII